jgi:hypothetical protein
VRLCPRACTCAFFFNVGTALYQMLGDRYISARAFAHPTRRALSRMMELS